MKIWINLVVCFSLLTINLYSQKKGDVYITKDSLSQFQFVDHGKVYYTLYTKTGSPYILRKTMSFIDNFHISTEKSGLGNYYMKNDTIFVAFPSENNFKDSLNVSYFIDKGRQQRIHVKQRDYFSRKPNEMSIVVLYAYDSTYTNLHEHDFYAPIQRSALPYKVNLMCGFSANEIEIKKYRNTLVELFTNEYYSHQYPDTNFQIKLAVKDLIKRPN